MPPAGMQTHADRWVVSRYWAALRLFFFAVLPLAVRRARFGRVGVRPSRIELRDWEEPKLDAADQLLATLMGRSGQRRKYEVPDERPVAMRPTGVGI